MSDKDRLAEIKENTKHAEMHCYAEWGDNGESVYYSDDGDHAWLISEVEKKDDWIKVLESSTITDTEQTKAENKRLRAAVADPIKGSLDVAADLRLENKRLRTALKPFTKIALGNIANRPDTRVLIDAIDGAVRALKGGGDGR